MVRHVMYFRCVRGGGAGRLSSTSSYSIILINPLLLQSQIWASLLSPAQPPSNNLFLFNIYGLHFCYNRGFLNLLGKTLYLDIGEYEIELVYKD